MTQGMSDGYDRRIGGRVDTAAIPVQWRIPDPDEKRRAFRRAPKAETGLLIDVSVSGIQIRAAAADDLGRGARVRVALDGVVGWGTIRRASPVPGGRYCDYGIELARDSTDLVQWVHDRVAAGSSGLTQTDWR